MKKQDDSGRVKKERGRREKMMKKGEWERQKEGRVEAEEKRRGERRKRRGIIIGGEKESREITARQKQVQQRQGDTKEEGQQEKERIIGRR